MIDAGRVLLAADTLGAAAMMVDKAVAYAKEREQFNRPIGSFQAVKHMCAEMAAPNWALPRHWFGMPPTRKTMCLRKRRWYRDTQRRI